MFRKKAFWIVLIVLAVVGGGGYASYAYWFAPQEAVQESTLKTATVTVGDLSITADGTGMLVAASEVELAFSTSGTLLELPAQVGDSVQAGDVLGRIDDTDARQAVADAELGVLQAEDALKDAADTASLEQAVAQDELQVAQTEADLETARSDLGDLLNWAPDETEVEIAKANLAIAQGDYQNTVTKASMRDEQIASTRINLEGAIRDLEAAQVSYANAMDAARDWEKNIESTRARAAETLRNAQDSLEITQASYDLATIDSSAMDVQNARVQVLNAQQTLDDLQTPPDAAEIAAAQLQVQGLEVTLSQAKLDLADAQEALAGANTAEAELSLQQAQLKLESAQDALAGTTLIAPMSGTVVEVDAQVGETANGTVLVLADLGTPVVQFWVEESDLSNVAVGNRVNIVFDALPDLTYAGQITRIDPVLVTVSSTPAVQVWASIDTTAYPTRLLGDMNAEVEVVAGEATNALLVPVQALREIGDGQYVAFVVGSDGALEMRTVEVGLMNYVNAQVVSGLAQGEVVSIGEGTTSSSSQTSTSTQSTMPAGDPGMMPMMGG